jgi:hypothetical protein
MQSHLSIRVLFVLAIASALLAGDAMSQLDILYFYTA